MRTAFALTSDHLLVKFNSNTPGTSTTTVGVSGLAFGESLLAIDIRPATGQLYALSNLNKLYTINTSTGLATQVGSAAFTPVLSGTYYGFDFNPTVDRIRLHSDLRQDLRLHPETGAVAAVDTNLSYAAGDVNASAAAGVTGTAYTNSVAGATTTTLYAIDSERDALVKLNNPNDGKLTTVGSLTQSGSVLNVNNQVGFDIAPDGYAYASLKSSDVSNLYRVDLSNGALTLIGPIGNATVIGLALQ